MHCSLKAYCATLFPIDVLDVSNFHHQIPLRPHNTRDPRSKRWNLRGENSNRKFCLNADFHGTFRDLLRAVNLRHGTDGFTSPPKEGAEDFSPLKILTASAGFKPANLGTQRQRATPRPPKPLCIPIVAVEKK